MDAISLRIRNGIMLSQGVCFHFLQKKLIAKGFKSFRREMGKRNQYPGKKKGENDRDVTVLQNKYRRLATDQRDKDIRELTKECNELIELIKVADPTE